MLTVTVSDSNFGSNFSLNLGTLRRWGVMGDAPNVSGIDDVVVQMATKAAQKRWGRSVSFTRTFHADSEDRYLYGQIIWPSGEFRRVSLEFSRDPAAEIVKMARQLNFWE